MNTNKVVVVIAFFVAASLGFAQGMRGTGGGGMAGQPIDGTTIKPKSIVASGNVSASTLSVGTTSTSTRAHFLTEATAYTPTDFSTAHAVFGRNPVSGAGSGGVWLSYHTTDNEGIVGSLSPVVSWRPLSFASSEWKFRQNGATLIANITSTGAFNSVAASGNQAFTCTNVGCRLSLGNTGRYLVDDGNRLSTSGDFVIGNVLRVNNVIQQHVSGVSIAVVGRPPNNASAVGVIADTDVEMTTAGAKLLSVRTGTIEKAFIDKDGAYTGLSCNATATSGSSFTGGNSSNVMTLTSNTTDAVTSGTVPAIRLQASQNITDTDLLMSVEDSAGNRRLTVSELGALATGGTITISGGSGTAVGRYFIGGTTPVEIGTNMAIGTEKAPIRLYTFNAFTADDVSLVSIRSGGSGNTEVAHFSKDGLLRVNEANAAKPTCNADNRGRIFFLDGASGVADIAEICGKDAANVYAWKAIATF